MRVPASPQRLDLVDMRRRLGDDDELISDLLDLFLEDYPARIDAIADAIKSGDAVAARRAAHSLKGSASNVSAYRVVEAAAVLESSAERGETNLDTKFTSLAAEVDALARELRGEQL
jgi:HPt (histidine-containing phosphotransfer) domain-containing protein